MVPVLGDPDPGPFASCPPRPASETREQLNFTRSNKMFRWLGPKGLLDVAMQVVLSGMFGRFVDKREVEAALPIHELDLSAMPELWLDYVGDVGDGFAPTYTIARLLSQELLGVSLLAKGSEVHETERGRLLVLGGDEVYPVASDERYENQFKGPYRAALPCTDEAEAPAMLAIPGNHDWYDGLTTFMRLFCAKRWIGGWKTEQDRSYFAAKLPHGWWLWGIDIAFDFYIDDPQMSYFRSIADRMESDSRIILCTGKPSWVHERMAGDQRYQAKLKGKRNLEFFEREIIRKAHLGLPIVLSGDLHHYARYQAVEGHEHRITSGGGGAFLYPTHHLPAETAWGESVDEAATDMVYARQVVFPDVRTSKRLRRGIPLSAFRNGSFGLVTAGLQLALLWLLALPLRAQVGSFSDTVRDAGVSTLSRAMVRSPLIVVLIIALLAGLVVFADAWNAVKRIAMGLAHWCAYLAVFLASMLTWGALSSWHGTAFAFGLIAWVALWGYVGGSFVMGMYLFLSQMGGRHPNEAFSAQHLMDYKNFLRLRIAGDGSLTIYPVGVTAVPRDWRVVPDGPPNAPWFEPVGAPIDAHLIEEPIIVPPLRAQS